jgi:hypothetical protein
VLLPAPEVKRRCQRPPRATFADHTRSRRLARSLIAEGLVDECRLWVFPVLLGVGERLLGDGLPSTGLRLVGSRTSESGVVVHTYEPAGPLTFGAFEPDAGG